MVPGDRCYEGTVANGSWVELTYGAHSTHSLGWCPFDRWSTPATRAAPRSEVGRDAKVVPSNERRNGLRHTLTRTRRRLSAWLRGGSHVGGGRRKAALWSDTLWGEREGAKHRQGLRTVYSRAEPGPPPEKEAKIFRCRYHPAWARRRRGAPRAVLAAAHAAPQPLHPTAPALDMSSRRASTAAGKRSSEHQARPAPTIASRTVEALLEQKCEWVPAR